MHLLPCLLVAVGFLTAGLVEDPASGGAAAEASARVPSEWLTADGAGGVVASPGVHAALRSWRDAGGATLTIMLPVADLGPTTLTLRPMRAFTRDARVGVSGVGTVDPPTLDARVAMAGADAAARGTPGAQRVDDSLTAVLHDVVHLNGTVVGHESSSAYVAVGRTGIAALLDLGHGQGLYALRRIHDDTPGLCSGALEFVRVNGTSAPEVPACATDCAGHDGGGTLAGFANQPPGARRVVELAADCDWEFMHLFNGDATAATEYVSSLVGAVSAIYRRDCDASIVLSYLRLQLDPDDLFNDPDPLTPFRNWWNENGGEVHRDVFTLLTGRRNLPYGGVAWLNAACEDFGYSVNGYLNGRFADAFATHPGNWDVNVLAHELGHNLGTLHTHDYSIDSCASGTVQRGTIMSYCHVVSGASSNIDLRFHAGTVEPITAFIASAACLSTDCDDDGLWDADEIDADPLLDTNADGLLDACQDCNANGIPDPVEISAGTLEDADADLRPDACEADCDGNGVPDSLDIALDPSKDTNGDLVLQSCEPDCDANGIADSDDLLADMSLDRSRDARPDACEDCDGDGTTDFRALRGSRSRWVGSRADALLRELDPRSGVLRRAIVVGSSSIVDLVILPAGPLLAAEGVRVWLLDREDPFAAPVQWHSQFQSQLSAIAITPDGGVAVMQSNGRTSVHQPTGALQSNYLPSFADNDARDLVFRTMPDGTHEAIVTRANGVVMAYSWPGGVGRVLADLSAQAPGLHGAFAMTDGSVLVAASLLNSIIHIAADGTDLGEWDVDNGGLLNGASALCASGDGRAVLGAAVQGGSTVNGFALANGYTERTYRIYSADAPQPISMIVAPPSATDLDGNLMPDVCQPTLGDITGDGVVNGADLGQMLGAWGACAGCSADINRDGVVDGADLGIMLGHWSP